MNLTNCPACNHQVSSAASTCPSCGQPLRRWARGLYAVKLVIMLVVVGLLLWLVASTACTVYHTHLDSDGHFLR
jgi:uncharacterized paraquat-inducible protein A